MKALKRQKNQKTETQRRSFKERVLGVVAAIPVGETLTYKEVADRAGSPNAYRAVGSIMSRNFRPDIPCHRVVKSDGSLGSYNRGGAAKKLELLQKEKAL